MRRGWLWGAVACLSLAAVSCGGEAVEWRTHAIRPTDGDGWHGNGYGTAAVSHWDTPGGAFRVHYTVEGPHGVSTVDAEKDGVPDFVQEFGRTFDKVLEAYQQLGFRRPLSDATYHDRPDYGGDERFDVYLQDRGGSSDGYLVTEACTSSVPAQCAGYMVVENDFRGYSYKTPLEGMKVLASHEFFHAIQNAYVGSLDQAFSEGSAVWATEMVFPETADFDHFIAGYFKKATRPVDDEPTGPGDSFPYYSAIWPRFLSERYGESIIAEVLMELSLGKSTSATDAVGRVLSAKYQTGLPEAFGEFALWNYFTGNRARDGFGYANAASYPLLPIVEQKKPHPYRITGEIAYLSAVYHRLSMTAGTVVTVSVDYPQPELVLHLITGDPKAPTVVSSKPKDSSLSIVAEGDVLLVAASTARRDRHLPLSLAVVGREQSGEPASTKDAGPAEAGPQGDDSPVGDGCAVGSRGAGYPLFALTFWALLLLRRRTPLLVALLALTLAACSDDSGGPVADATVDATPDLGVDTLSPDLAPQPLALGAFVDFEADPATGQIAIDVPAEGGERLMIVLMSLHDEPLLSLEYGVMKTTAATWPELPLPSANGADHGHDGRFQRDLQVIAATARGPLGKRRLLPIANDPVKVGDVRQFKVASAGSVKEIDAEALLVDDTAIYWIDRTTTPKATIEQGILEELAAGFSKVVVPRERIYFGEESDVNGDGHISVLISPLTHAGGAVAYVSPCDLVDPTVVPGCVASNQQELVYLSPPDQIGPPYNTAKAMLETIAHEFQHTIYFYRKYVKNETAGTTENPYITEGLSHLAQDLSGYQAGNYYVVAATLDGIDLVAVPNLGSARVSQYVPKPGDGIMRGASYLLLRYLYDRAGGDAMDAEGNPVDKGGIAFLHRFIDQKETGMASLLAASGMSYEQLVKGFWTTMALSNRVSGGKPVSNDPQYGFQPTFNDPITGRDHGCDLFLAFHGSQLTGPATQTLDKADGKLRPGGAELFEVKLASDASSYKLTLSTHTKLKALARVIRIR